MALINDPAFLDRDLGSTNGAVLRFLAEDPIITISCTGEIQVIYTNAAGEQQTDTYADLEAEDVTVAAAAASPIYLIGAVTGISTANQLQSVDLRALRTLTILDLSGQPELFSINLYGCRKLEELSLSGCTGLQHLDLKENVLLQQLNLSGCTGLQKLDLRTNTLLRVVDLTDCTGLSYLDATMLTSLEDLQLDGTQLRSPGNTLLIARAAGGGGVPTGVAMESTSQEILQKVSTITAVEPDLLAGKEAIAQQITNKGVPTQPNEALAKMAENIRLITQSEVIIDGGDLYTAQMYADGNLYNLYQVLAEIKNNVSIWSQYSAVVLAEYYKGYASISLQGADAYLTSDGKFYSGAIVHTWDDAESGIANRWVAYLFVNYEAPYTVPTSDVCPRRIFIGGHMGNIDCPYPRLLEVVVPDEVVDGVQQNTLLSINGGSGSVSLGQIIVLKNIKTQTTGFLVPNGASIEFMYYDIKTFTNPLFGAYSTGLKTIKTLVLPSIESGSFAFGPVNISRLEMPNLKTCSTLFTFNSTSNPCLIYDFYLPRLEQLTQVTNYGGKIVSKKLYMPELTYLGCVYNAGDVRQLEELICPKLTNFTRLDASTGSYGTASLRIIEVGALDHSCDLSTWNPGQLSDESTVQEWLDNFYNKFALKVSDRTGLSSLTLKLTTTVKTALQNEQDQRILNTFSSKNWTIA